MGRARVKEIMASRDYREALISRRLPMRTKEREARRMLNGSACLRISGALPIMSMIPGHAPLRHTPPGAISSSLCWL